MVKYEIRKLFQKTSTRLLLLILFLANAYLVWNQRLPETERYDSITVQQIQSLYAALPDDPDSALAALNQQNNILLDALWNGAYDGVLLTEDLYTECRLFSHVTARVEAAANYKEYLQSIEENSQTLLLSGRYEEQAGFGYRNIQRSLSQYRSLESVQPQIFYSGAVEMLPGGRITDVIVLLICLLVGLELICGEYTSGTLVLIKPTCKGRKPLILAKIAAAILVTTISVLILYGTNLIIGVLRCGTFPLDAPIQSIFGFQSSPWKISVLGYLLGFFFLKLLWALAICAIGYVSCMVGTSAPRSCGVFLLLVLPSLLLAKNHGFLGSASLISAGDTAHLFSGYRNLNLLSYPVSTFSVSLIAVIIIILIGFGLTVYLHKTTSPIVTQDRKRRKKGKYTVSVNLFGHEMRKILVMNGGIWVLLGLLLVQFFTYWEFDAPISTQERLYIGYSDILSGAASEEKDAYVISEDEHFRELQKQLEQYSQMVVSGDLSQENYEVLSSGILRQLENQAAFDRAKTQYEQMKMLGCDYVCLTSYARLLGEDGQREFIRQAVFLLISLILGLSGVFAIESETGMLLLLNTTVQRSGSAKRKHLIAALYAATAAVIAYAPQVVAIAVTYGLPGLTAAAESVPAFVISVGTVWTALTFYGIVTVLAATVVAMLILLISKLSRSTIQTLLYSAALFFVPAALMLWIG